MLSYCRVQLCNPMDCSPPGSSVHGDSPGKNSGVGYHALLQGLNPGGNPGTEPRSPTLQVDSLPSESPGKPKNTGRPSIITIVLLYNTAPLTDFLSLVSWRPFCFYSLRFLLTTSGRIQRVGECSLSIIQPQENRCVKFKKQTRYVHLRRKIAMK